MKIIEINSFGSSDVLNLRSTSMPCIDESMKDTLLIKVYAAGINPIDSKVRAGTSFASESVSFPLGLGYDVCGEVINKTSDVSDINVGDVVFGMLDLKKPGAYSEYCLVERHRVILKPSSIKYTEAAALPIAGLTAWQALNNHGELKKGEKVLINAAAGGVGHLAVQIAKSLWAYVIAITSSKNESFLQDLGADKVILYDQDDFTDKVSDIDLVIYLIGGDVGEKSLDVLKSSGRVITVPTITRDYVIEKSRNRGIVAKGMLAQMNSNDLEQIVNMLVTRNVNLHLDKVFSFDQVKIAHELIDSGHTRGKLVLSTEVN